MSNEIRRSGIYFRVEWLVGSPKLWQPYRDGQLFRRSSSAWRLVDRIKARYTVGLPPTDIRVSTWSLPDWHLQMSITMAQAEHDERVIATETTRRMA